jgi:hypothetical protein
MTRVPKGDELDVDQEDYSALDIVGFFLKSFQKKTHHEKQDKDKEMHIAI